MKKQLSLPVVAFLALLLQAHRPALQPQQSVTHPLITSDGRPWQIPQENAFVEYTWYMDPYYWIPTGSILSPLAEMNRLRETYPGNNFSSFPSLGLHPFEWGYFSPSVTTIIYSDLYW